MNKKDGKDAKPVKEGHKEGHGEGAASERSSFDVVASVLDERTHAELMMLYRESTETMRFIKTHQWRTVGSTLMVFVGLVGVLRMAGPTAAMADRFMGVVILLTVAAIFALIIYQFWTHNEISKLDRMQPFMSNLFGDIRALKSKKEGNFHRYTLLFFMIIVIILGASVVHMAFSRMILY